MEKELLDIFRFWILYYEHQEASGGCVSGSVAWSGLFHAVGRIV